MHFKFDSWFGIFFRSRILIHGKAADISKQNEGKHIRLKMRWIDGCDWGMRYDKSMEVAEITYDEQNFVRGKHLESFGAWGNSTRTEWRFFMGGEPFYSIRFRNPWWSIRFETAEGRLMALARMGCGWVRVIYRPTVQQLVPVIGLIVMRQIIASDETPASH